MIVSRSTWGARSPKVRLDKATGRDLPPYDKHTPVRVVLHHSFQPKASAFGGDRTIRGIQDFHMDKQNWSDIGYHFLVSPDGLLIYEGRPVDAIGAHCGNTNKKARAVFGNTNSIGICLIGDYDTEKPSPQAVLTIQGLISFLEAKFGFKLPVFGHFQAAIPSPKSCPGGLLSEAFGLGEEWKKVYAR
jgi:N-acetylmuramoyl-L-alanine amidase